MDSGPAYVRTRLSVMMFLEFFVYGCWGVAIAGYGQTLGFSGSEIGWLIAVGAIGAIISPLFVGLIADRFFAAQRVLSVLHVLGGACLIGAGFQTTFLPLVTLMLLTGLAFMPTMALVNAVGFRHIPDPDKFPRIAVLGTIGWIVANLVAEVFLGGAAKPNFLFLGGAGSLVLALYAWTLPHTPPKGAEPGRDVLGLSALKLLKESTFLIFIVCVFLLSIPACGYYFALMVPMFQQRGYPAPLALGTLNQFPSELVFMFTMPWFVSKLGLKRVLLIGMTAWAVRYLCFSSPVLSFPLALLGLLLHGFCYSFFYVGAYMWVDRRAPAELKSSAQSLLTFLLLGVGYLLGAKGAGFMMDRFPPAVPFVWRGTVVEIAEQDNADPNEATRAIVKLTRKAEKEAQTVLEVADANVKVAQVKAPLPPWNAPPSAWDYLNLSGTVNRLVFGEEPKRAPDIADKLDKNGDGNITMAEVKAMDRAGLTFGAITYSRDEMISLFKRIAKAQERGQVTEDEISLDRKQWLKAQSCNWTPIWLWPSAAAFVVLGFFALAFRDKPRVEAGTEK